MVLWEAHGWKKGSIFHKPVEFVGYIQTHILVDISEHPTEVEILLFSFGFTFFIDFTFFHFFCTCNMHYRIEQHGGKDKSMYPQIVRSSQTLLCLWQCPLYYIKTVLCMIYKKKLIELFYVSLLFFDISIYIGTLCSFFTESHLHTTQPRKSTNKQPPISMIIINP